MDVPTPVDQPFEQLVHSTRDVHVPVPRTGFLAAGQNGYRIRARSAVDPRRHVSGALSLLEVPTAMPMQPAMPMMQPMAMPMPTMGMGMPTMGATMPFGSTMGGF